MRVRGLLYDLALRPVERAGLRAGRRSLVAQARGQTLEIGAGTGLNLPHYGPAVTRLVLAEPDPAMAARLRRRAARLRPAAEVVVAPAERLPAPDASFDTVVCTLVLCTARDPQAALAEVARVLRPGGRLLFAEHVRSGEPRLARRQDLLRPLWRRIAGGCEPNRRTLEAIEASPLRLEWTRRGRLPRSPAIVRPLVAGAARRPGGEG